MTVPQRRRSPAALMVLGAGIVAAIAGGSSLLRRHTIVATPAAIASPTPQSAPVQTARITVREDGFNPASLTVRANAPVQITFLRTTDKTCATEVVFPSLKIRQALPLNQPVRIDFTPRETKNIVFVCGMNMLRGTVVVQ